MTRDEAVSLLHDMKDTYDEIHENTNYEIGYEQMTALDMAISALSKPNYESDTEVRLAVTDRNKDKVVLWDAFGEVEYYPHTDGDLISRADAIEAVCDNCTSEKYCDRSCRHICVLPVALSALPSAEAVQGWTPCSERLPSESGQYICTLPFGDNDDNEVYVWALSFHNGRFYDDDDEWGMTFYDDVIAWQPLPKPYKGGDGE